MNLTKEKIVFALALLIAVLSTTGIHASKVEPVPAAPPPGEAHKPHGTAYIPELSPSRVVDDASRDPFVAKSDWVSATPAALDPPPLIPTPRVLPGATLPGTAGPLLVLPKDPTPVPEPDAPPPGGEQGGG